MKNYASSSADTSCGSYGMTNYYMGRNVGMLLHGMIWRTTDIRFWCGLTDQTGATFGESDSPSGANYAAFRYSTLAGDTNFKCVTSDASGQTVEDSGVAANTNEHAFAIECDDGSGNIKFYIDGTLVATVTTRRPTTGSDLCYYLSGMWHSASRGRLVGLSYVAVQSDL